MNSAVLLKVMLWWATILVFAILNGFLREAFLIPSFGTFTGQIVSSGIILSFLVLVVAFVAVPGFGKLSPGHYWIIGLIWLVMTLIFEFGFGLLVQKKPISDLLEAYTFKGGNIWPVVLVSIFASPRLAALMRNPR